jgi:taurine dioxygenase
VVVLAPLSPTIGVEVTGMDLAEMVDHKLEVADQLNSLLLKHRLLLFRSQTLTALQQLEFAGWFGQAEASTPQAMQEGIPMPTPVHFISNRVEGGRAGDGELVFHSDSAAREHPLRAVVLYAVAIPRTGGDTLFANCVYAYTTLPETLRTLIANLRAQHGYDYERYEKSPPGGPGFHAEHPVAMPHPLTGEIVLYLSRNATTAIVGLPSEDSDRILDDLFASIEAPNAVYQHTWRVGDLIIWDNVALVHARTAFDPAEERTLQRVTVSGKP